MGDVILVSACLMGLNTRYDGGNSYRSELSEIADELFRGATLLPFCPEQLGGLPTPRPKSGIKGSDGQEGLHEKDEVDGSDVLRGSARVFSESGADVTEEFLRGASEVLRIAERYKGGNNRLRGVILKEKSPSCGVNLISGGSERRRGVGVTTAMLLDSGKVRKDKIRSVE